MTAIVLFSLTFLLMSQSLVAIIQGTGTGTGTGYGTVVFVGTAVGGGMGTTAGGGEGNGSGGDLGGISAGSAVESGSGGDIGTSGGGGVGSGSGGGPSAGGGAVSGSGEPSAGGGVGSGSGGGIGPSASQGNVVTGGVGGPIYSANSGGAAGSNEGGGVATGGAGGANSGSSQACPWNEAYTTCGSSCSDNCPDGTVNTFCAAVCLEGCYCKDGFKRNNGRCIPESQCPINNPNIVCTKSNEVYSTCGNRCTNICHVPHGNLCPIVCETGCFCKSGFKRDNNGNCVPENQCSRGTCADPKMTYRYGCECLENCLKPKNKCPRILELNCHCKRGTKLNPYTNQCVRPNQCPRRNRNNNN